MPPFKNFMRLTLVIYAVLMVINTLLISLVLFDSGHVFLSLLLSSVTHTILFFITIALTKRILYTPGRSNTDFLESFLDSMAVPSISIDFNYNVTYINSAALLKLNRTADEVVGLKCSEVWKFEGCNTTDCAVECLKRNASPSHLYTHNERTIECLVSFLNDKNGNCVGYVSSAIDVTDKSNSIRDYKEKAHLYEDVLDSFLDNPISVVDKNMKLQFLNKAACDLLNIKLKEVKGKYCGDI